MPYQAVLFDWSGTLVHDPRPSDRVAHALRAVGRDSGTDRVAAITAQLDGAATLPDVAAALRDEDTSAPRHRASNHLWFARAGLDDELAAALYAFDNDITNRPLYPDAPAVLAALRRARVRVAVVSDIHIDIRTLLRAQGVGDHIDEYVLSFERGFQKPDPRMFRTALDLLGTAAERTLMVGDRASHDGGAVAVGIATYILPPAPAAPERRGLDVVARLACH